MAAKILSAATSAASTISIDATSTSSIISTSLAATATPSLFPFAKPPFPFNTPLFSGVYNYLCSNLPITLTQLLLLPFYLIYHIEVFVLSTLPRYIANTFKLDALLKVFLRMLKWAIDDILGDIDFIVKLAKKAGFTIGRQQNNANGDDNAGTVAGAFAEDPIDSVSDFAELVRGSGVMSYFTSRWGMSCLLVSIIINRISVFARTRVPIQLTWKHRLVLRAIPIVILSRSLFDILRAMRCQFSPQYAVYRYGDASIPLKHLDYGNESGTIYSIVSTFLSLFEGEADSCSAMGMAHVPGQASHPLGSFSLLWSVYICLCISQFIDAFACAVSGRTQMHEMGSSLFEQSLMFSEAQGMTESGIEMAIAKYKRKQKSQGQAGMLNSATSQMASFAAATVTGITYQTPSPAAASQSFSSPMSHLNSVTSMLGKRPSTTNHFNVTPEMLVLTAITIAHNLCANILCLFGKEHRYRLAHTTFWALCLFAYNMSGFHDIRSFIRYPTVAIVGFGPHLSLMLGILGCLMIYGLALTFTAFSLPDELPENLPLYDRLKVRFLLAQSNMQSEATIRFLHVNRSEEFFSALVRIGYEVLSAASKMVFLNEGKEISARELTWLEEERLAELANDRQEQAEKQGHRTRHHDTAAFVSSGGEVRGRDEEPPSLADCTDLFNFDLVGRERRWKSGYAIEKQFDERTEENRNGMNRQRHAEFVGVGLWRNVDRIWQSFTFWRAIWKLVLGWICFGIVKGMDKIGWRWKPKWLVWMAGIPKEEALKASERERKDQENAEGEGQEGSQGMDDREFYVYDNDGKPVLPQDKDFDVETEMRKREFKAERNWSEESEQRFERKLYEWWRNGGRWGEADASGDYVPETGSENWDTTSIITTSSSRSATPSIAGEDDDGWEDDGGNEDGRRTPTQSNPWGDDTSSTSSVIRRRHFRTSTPNPEGDSDSDPLLDVDHLSRLLEGRDMESRNEAHILASHLRASKEGRIMTRARYRKELELQKARVLTSSRRVRAEVHASSLSAATTEPADHVSLFTRLQTDSPLPSTSRFTPASMYHHYFQPDNEDHKPSLSEESEILERLILARRLKKPSNPLSLGLTSTFGAHGPQCVICHSAPRSVISWPCRCLTVCEDCRVQCAMNNMGRCVTCRRDVTGYARLWVP